MHIRDLFDLTGKTAIVTGGGRGIGRQLAETVGELGAHIVICARKFDIVEAAAQELSEQTGVKVLPLQCDVREREQVQAVVDRTVEEFGQVDILVNNSGVSWGQPFLEIEPDAWQKVLDVNLTGTYHFTQAVGRHMVERGEGGKIVIVASTTGLGGMPEHVLDAVVYNTSKGGLITFTKDLAVKWAKYGIQVNCMAPGWFPAGMSREITGSNPEYYLDRIPLKRFGSAQDLKGTMALLASRASDFMTGSVVVIDGGESAW